MYLTTFQSRDNANSCRGLTANVLPVAQCSLTKAGLLHQFGPPNTIMLSFYIDIYILKPDFILFFTIFPLRIRCGVLNGFEVNNKEAFSFIYMKISRIGGGITK
jgi:hypothetical protein